ncbi:hypothetical protein EBB07_18490 [Paenibacillaceae bacterium]|nr:hypothetical protein EBB07_18490 [Paenibacillaceae bacterium]
MVLGVLFEIINRSMEQAARTETVSASIELIRTTDAETEARRWIDASSQIADEKLRAREARHLM